MLRHLPREYQVNPLLVGGLALGNALHGVATLVPLIRVLHQHATHHAPVHGLSRVAGAYPLPRLKQAHVGLAGKHLEGVLVVCRRPQHLNEHLSQVLSQRQVHRAVYRVHTAKGRHRVTRLGAQVGACQVVAQRHPAWVVVLHDHHGWIIELGHQPAAGVNVEQVVVRQRLTVKHLHAAQQVLGRADLAVVGAALMRVLAVAALQFLREADGKAVGEVLGAVALRCHPCGDGIVVGGGLAKGGGGQRPTGGVAHGTAALHLGQYIVVLRRVGHDGHAVVVLGRCPHHCGAADVDLLHHVCAREAVLGRRLLKRVQVDHHDLDGLDAVGGHVGGIALVVPAAKDSPVHLRVQRLHAAPHDLWVASDLAHVRHGKPGIAQGFGGAARGDELYARLRQASCQVNQTGLVGYRQQGASCGHLRNLPHH